MVGEAERMGVDEVQAVRALVLCDLYHGYAELLSPRDVPQVHLRVVIKLFLRNPSVNKGKPLVYKLAI